MSVTYSRTKEVAKWHEDVSALSALNRAEALKAFAMLEAGGRTQEILMGEVLAAMRAPLIALQKLLHATGMGGTELKLNDEASGGASIAVVIDRTRQQVCTRWVDEVRQADWSSGLQGASSSTADANERAEISSAFNELCEAVRSLTDPRVVRVLSDLVPEGRFANTAKDVLRMFARTLPKEVRTCVDRSLRPQLPVVAFLAEVMSDLQEVITTPPVGRPIQNNRLLRILLSFGITLQLAAEGIVEPSLRKIQEKNRALRSERGLQWRADLLAQLRNSEQTTTQPPGIDPVVRAIFLLTKELSGEQCDVSSQRLLDPIAVLERAGFSAVAETLQSLDPRELAMDGTEILGEPGPSGTISDRILQMVFPEQLREMVVVQARAAEQAVLTAELSQAMKDLDISESYWPRIEGEADLTALRERCAVLQEWGTDMGVEVSTVLTVMPELLTVSENEFLSRLSALTGELAEVLKHMPSSLSHEDLKEVRRWFTTTAPPPFTAADRAEVLESNAIHLRSGRSRGCQDPVHVGEFRGART